MVSQRERKVNVSGKPRHSLDTNRSNGSNKTDSRSAATVRCLKMINTKPKRNRKGEILKYDLQERDLPNTRIQPDRRGFEPTRVVNQKHLEILREELRARISKPGNVLLQQKKLPLSLLNYHQKQVRVHLLDTEPFQDAFGPKRKRKRPRLLGN